MSSPCSRLKLQGGFGFGHSGEGVPWRSGGSSLTCPAPRTLPTTACDGIRFATFLEQQFVQVIGADPGRLVTKTSQNSFKLFATGRRGCRGMLCQLDLKRRQNLVRACPLHMRLVLRAVWRAALTLV